ncbi:MAG: hypothetical protein QG656_1630 [Candidatus Hydrogenedentes bacterium]|nr:hypothetical protein [Candidatus Hydrogenedentota bacterium]
MSKEDGLPLSLKQYVLAGQTVCLRPPKPHELAFVCQLWADPETMEPVGGPVEYSEERMHRWFAYMVDPGSTSNCYCLIFNADDEPVGEVSFHHWDAETKKADFNIKVLAIHRRKGYAQDALRTLLAYFFGSFGGLIMTDELRLENVGGQRFIAQCGFEHDPSRTDVHLMRITKEMFVSQYGAFESKK